MSSQPQYYDPKAHRHQHGPDCRHDHEHRHGEHASPQHAGNPLANRKLILCQNHPPAQCVHCDKTLPGISQQRLLMINAEGEAGVVPGPVQLCEGCDAVYVHEVHYGAIAREFGFDPYTLVGFIDLGLLPEDQRDQPIGEDPEAEIPLLEFSAVHLLQQARFD